MIITSGFLSFNVWEWFSHSSVLERTKSDLSKINWLRGVILLIPIVLVPWDMFPLCHTSIRPISAFQDQISILIVGCVTTWSRGSHQWVSELGSETRSYPSVFFVFFSVPLSFSVFASIFLFFVSVSSKQKDKRKKKRVIFHLVTVSNHISILKRKRKRERERGISWNLKDHSIFTAETKLLVNHKHTTSESIETSYSVYWGWDRIIYQIWAYSDIVFLRF